MSAEKSSSVKTVFLSSVARGLEEYREAVYKAIERLSGYHCVRMEDFGAQPEDPVAICSKRAASCDVFVGIAGQRYGSSPPDDDRSMTEIEYDAGAQRGRAASRVPCSGGVLGSCELDRAGRKAGTTAGISQAHTQR
jgi:hypothetical protein